MILNIVKSIYGRPFRHEDRSIFSIILYRFTLIIVKTVYSARYFSSLKRTRAYISSLSDKIQQDGRSAFVLANGPSLSSIDLEKLRRFCEKNDCDIIAINSFLSKSAHVIKPTMAVFADNVHFSDGDTQYARDIATCRELSIPYFVPARHNTENTEQQRYSYCSLCDVDSKNVTDILRPVGYYGVTAFFALSLSIMLGYRKIYICGFDNSYFKDFEVDENGKMLIRHRHYYDVKSEDTIVLHSYGDTKDFFYDAYQHFFFLNKIMSNRFNILNVAKDTYLSFVKRCNTLDIYI